MPISANAVKELRARTGVSILECKKALEEAAGDEEKAIDILRKSGIASAVKKAGRDQREGLVFIAQQGNRAAVVELKCETDFVARADAFGEAGQQLARTLLTQGEEALKALANQSIPELIQKLGENISLGITKVLEAPVLGVYVHSNSKIGVVVGLTTGTQEIARDVAMHAAALSPLYVRPEEVEESVLVKEREIWAEQLTKEGKPAQILEKIMMGKEKKFREENALLTQPFVKDPHQTVKAYLKGADIATYLRVAIGG
jgi:elongation factor Ts